MTAADTVVSGTYDEWHGQYAGHDDAQSVWHMFIKNTIRPETDLDLRRVMEIGCGRGGLSNYLSHIHTKPCEIYACDFSENGLQIAREKYMSRPQINWVRQDIQDLSFENEFFDTIISCETLEHVANPARALTELYRTLKPGGTVFLTCPNYFNLFGLWCIYRSVIGKPYTEGQPYVNYLLLPALLRMIRRAGFGIHHLHTADLVLPLRAHYHYFQDRMPRILKWFGFRSFLILKKK